MFSVQNRIEQNGIIVIGALPLLFFVVVIAVVAVVVQVGESIC